MGDVRKLREAVGRLRDHVGYLDAKHTSHMIGLGRDPMKYVSGYSIARDQAAAILRALEGGDT